MNPKKDQVPQYFISGGGGAGRHRSIVGSAPLDASDSKELLISLAALRQSWRFTRTVFLAAEESLDKHGVLLRDSSSNVPAGVSSATKASLATISDRMKKFAAKLAGLEYLMDSLVRRINDQFTESSDLSLHTQCSKYSGEHAGRDAAINDATTLLAMFSYVIVAELLALQARLSCSIRMLKGALKDIQVLEEYLPSSLFSSEAQARIEQDELICLIETKWQTYSAAMLKARNAVLSGNLLIATQLLLRADESGREIDNLFDAL